MIRPATRCSDRWRTRRRHHGGTGATQRPVQRFGTHENEIETRFGVERFLPRDADAGFAVLVSRSRRGPRAGFSSRRHSGECVACSAHRSVGLDAEQKVTASNGIKRTMRSDNRSYDPRHDRADRRRRRQQLGRRDLRFHGEQWRLDRGPGIHGRRWRAQRSGDLRHRDHDRRHDRGDRRAWRNRQRKREPGRRVRVHGNQPGSGTRWPSSAVADDGEGEQLFRPDRGDRRTEHRRRRRVRRHRQPGNALQGAAYVFHQRRWNVDVRAQARRRRWRRRRILRSCRCDVRHARARRRAVYKQVDGTAARGAVYMYDGSGGDWSQVQKVAADAGNPGDGFGYSLAATTANMLVGAGGSDGGQGAAFTFHDEAGSWIQDARAWLPTTVPPGRISATPLRSSTRR